MKTMIALAAAGLVAACANMESYYPNSKVLLLDGREFFVAPRPQNGPNAFIAGPNQVQQGDNPAFVDMSLYARNVAAIEQFTGCQVARESILNVPNTELTYAVADC